VKEQFAANVKRIKGELQQKLGEAETLFDDGELILKDKALVQRSYLSKAMKKVKEAQRLSHVFDVTGVMEAAFTAFEKLVEARRARIKSDLEAEAKRLKEEAAKEEVKAEAAA
jgi:septum formation inhibitor MinC